MSTALLLTVPAAGAANGSGAVAADMVRAALGRFPGFAGLPGSSTMDAPVILHGKLTETGGAAMAGAQVLLSAWPSNDTLHALPIGSQFSITPVARTVVGADGRYELRSASTPLLASLMTRDGLDVELDVFHGGRHYVYLSQVVPDRAVGAWVRRVVTQPLAEAPSERANSRNALNILLDRSAGQRLGRDLLHPAGLSSEYPPPAPPACGPYEKWAERTAMTTVATAVGRNGVGITTEYTRKATSELTTGASKDGSLSFTPAGSRSRTAGHGATWEEKVKRKATVAREYRVDWQHIVTKRQCAKDFKGNYDAAYMTSPDQTTGGVAPADKNSRRYPAWKCNSLFTRPAGGNKVHTESARAYTYGADWSLPVTPRAALTGSARSGYSDEVKITFSIPNPSKGYWCGTSGFPAAKGQRVQAVQGGKNERIPGS